MKLPMPSIHLSLILLFLSAAACAPVTPNTGGDIGTSHPGGEVSTTDDGGAAGTPDSGGAIGVLRISGPNVWLNDSPATDGSPVYLGNSVATGAGSSAKVEFADGGYLQLDENTDPDLEWLEQSKCLLIRILKGRVYLKKSHTCVEGPDISLILNSEVNLTIPPPPAPSEVTVIRGSAEVTLPTKRLKLVQGQQLTAIARAPEVKTLSPEVARSLTKWQKDFRFKPLRTPLRPDRVKPGTPGRLTPVPVTPDRGTPDAATPDPVTPDRSAPGPVTTHPVKPEPVTSSPVTPDTVAPDPVKPLPVAPEATTTDSTAEPPVVKRPVRFPKGVLRPKSAPVQENVQPVPELR